MQLRRLTTIASRRQFSSTAARRAINKICDSAQDAIKDMKSSKTILVGGFGFSGVPNSLINALRDRSELKDFTVVSNNAGMPGVGLGLYSKLELRNISFNGLNRTTSGNTADQQNDSFVHWGEQDVREDVPLWRSFSRAYAAGNYG